ncbi:BppU family phage baseplate upper protein [Tetragenococcus halophilus]|uniref:BppU family phage baseplate upper protein n=1 Tax=Tetragenococcus halophilus TaxID=51669 RepID=UPI000CCAB1B2|nr:BppU family phage baseplate upper protein [Tetragenococcus halophilus]GBD63785.1 hypothetical protein TEHD23766T_1212 [Tetragenococcus halophilus subsp. flandriensis]
MLRKIATIKVPKGAGPREVKTKNVFATYDKQSAAFEFFFSDNVNVEDATANVLFIIDGQKVFVEDGAALGGTNETHTFIYPLPDKLLNYTGKVDGYLYLNFADGSQSDEIHFTFSIKKSQIDEEMEEAPDVYIKSFEDIKAEVQEAADGAKETINQKVTEVSDTSDSAISKVNQAADDTIKTASEAKSDVQSKADEASYSIDEAVKSTESARDEAIETMTELDYSNRNLLPGTSDEWKTQTFTSWTEGYVRLSLNELGLKVGDTFTYALDIDNTIDEQNTDDVRGSITFRDPSDSQIDVAYTSTISGGKIGRAIVTAKIPEGTSVIRIAKYSKQEGRKEKTFAIRKIKLNYGTQATPWTPAPEDIVLKSEIEQIKQAITNLGGSV